MAFRGVIFQLQLGSKEHYRKHVPYKPFIHLTGISFRGWTNSGDVKIFNIAGDLVAKIKKTDNTSDGVDWNENTAAGRKPDKLASGIYIYLINDKVSGKMAILK